MSEIILHASKLYESTPNAPATITPGTSQTDVSQLGQKVGLSRGIVGLSLPYLVSYVQPINSPTGFIYACNHKDSTSIPGNPDDIVILRKRIETDVREVVLDTTNEVIQDIEHIFGNDFPKILDKFLQNGGEVYGEDPNISEFFISIALNKIIQKTNSDFVTWLEAEASNKGTLNIPTYDDISKIFGGIGELREALYRQTGKISRAWLIVSPRIAGFLSSTVGSTMNNGASIFNQGRIIPSNRTPNYVMTLGDIDVYQHNFSGPIAGGTHGTTEASGKMIMGYKGGPNVASVYYTPYKEYFIQGGSDYYTGQSSVFYRIRDAWETNPLDTYDNSLDSVYIEGTSTPVKQHNLSKYVVQANVTFGESLIQ